MDTELRHLRAFASVAEHRSFTLASQQLVITQPALSRTIQQLEAQLEVRLLERTSRSVELTHAGRAFLMRVQSLLREFDLAIAEARNERDIRIAFTWALPDPWFADAISSFEKETGATVHLMRRDNVANALLTGEVDIAFFRHRLLDKTIARAVLWEEPRVAALSIRSPLAQWEDITWRELAEYPVVINTVNGTTRADEWVPSERPKAIIECGTYDEWITLVASGRGVGANPLSASTSFNHSQVTFIPLVDAPPVALQLGWIPKPIGPLVRRFIDNALSQPVPRPLLSPERRTSPKLGATAGHPA